MSLYIVPLLEAQAFRTSRCSQVNIESQYMKSNIMAVQSPFRVSLAIVHLSSFVKSKLGEGEWPLNSSGYGRREGC